MTYTQDGTCRVLRSNQVNCDILTTPTCSLHSSHRHTERFLCPWCFSFCSQVNIHTVLYMQHHESSNKYINRMIINLLFAQNNTCGLLFGVYNSSQCLLQSGVISLHSTLLLQDGSSHGDCAGSSVGCLGYHNECRSAIPLHPHQT